MVKHSKSIKDMTPKEIVAGVKNGDIESYSYKSNVEYLHAMTK